MAQATTLILLPQTSFDAPSVINGTHTGTRQPAASFYLGNKDLQTLSWNVTSFTGTVTLQASLLDEPSDLLSGDWVNIATFVFNNDTVSSFQNINGNFVWLRARITGFSQGVIQNFKVSY